MIPCRLGMARLSSGCGWRKRPTDMDVSCKYVESEFADSRQGVIMSGDKPLCPKRTSCCHPPLYLSACCALCDEP
jgi:hypothetical protein